MTLNSTEHKPDTKFTVNSTGYKPDTKFTVILHH